MYKLLSIDVLHRDCYSPLCFGYKGAIPDYQVFNQFLNLQHFCRLNVDILNEVESGLLADACCLLLPANDIPDLQQASDLLILLSIIYQQQQRFDEKLSALERAKQKHEVILKRLDVNESSDVSRATRKILTR